MATSDTSCRNGLFLITMYLLPAAFGLSVAQTQADGIMGLLRPFVPAMVRQSECGDIADPFCESCDGGDRCSCPTCRSSGCPNPLRRHRWSHSVIWLNKPHSYTYFQPMTPYHQPGFGVHRTCWRTIPAEPCESPVPSCPPIPLKPADENLKPADENLNPAEENLNPAVGDTEAQADEPPIPSELPYDPQETLLSIPPEEEESARQFKTDESGFVKHQVYETTEAIEFRQDMLHANWVPWLYTVSESDRHASQSSSP